MDITINNRNIKYADIDETWQGIIELVLANLPKCDREAMIRRDILQNSEMAFGIPRLSVQIDRGRVDASLYVRLVRTNGFDGLPGAEGFKTWDMVVEVSWASTSRSIANATAAIKLYREVLDLAALVESTYGDGRIIGQVQESS